MIIQPSFYEKADGRFCFGESVSAYVPQNFLSAVLTDFWHGFCFHKSSINFLPSTNNDMCILIGSAHPCELLDCEYSINVTKTGICVNALDKTSLIHGYMTLLDMIESSDTENGKLYINCGVLRDKFSISNRMVHFCVFPETTLDYFEKFVRLCGFLRFTHIIVEFWGMLKYDVMPELSWENGYTKEQAGKILSIANDLGMKTIPMFNHLGHASQCRVVSGKHVVLDQNPALADYFDASGWAWNIKNPKTLSLLKDVRNELCELFGDGQYFHIGCDEVYAYIHSKDKMTLFNDYVNTIEKELENNGRRAVMWGDMLLYNSGDFGDDIYYCNAGTKEISQSFVSSLDKNIIIADWQYEAKKSPFKTSVFFKKHGFSTYVCPWYDTENIKAAAKTVQEENLSGIMYTTWHKLNEKMEQMLICANSALHGDAALPMDTLRCDMAALLRKVHFSKGVYENCGWSEKQISIDCPWIF